MSKSRPEQNDTPETDHGHSDNMTKHGEWTPEVSEAVNRELREMANDTDISPSDAATEKVDKSELSLPQERRPIDH
ncbi:hypothetical protein [Deinococcus hopiensis]|uniref:Uncharacterized protein n=1 Tax=Deinococcus hopiensis KR-140 TaxID=695939 RepID=A0A1W1UQH4_9DEIO|nr:hypothetical protein [Deinococcus hopiensis]SMB83385.1 hypothetical protein SAMN00790413_04406 [Deinococcus hopiensis KR-140]